MKMKTARDGREVPASIARAYGRGGVSHYVDLDKKQKEPTVAAKNTKQTRIKTLKHHLYLFGFGNAGFGTLVSIISLAFIAGDNEEKDTAFRFLGLANLCFSIGFIAITRALILARKIDLLEYILAGCVAIFFAFAAFNGLALLVSGSDLECESWYPLYDPDAGHCPCDTRAFFESNVSPVFDLNTNSELVKKPIRIATIGDIELSEEGMNVMETVAKYDPDLLVINGDLTYKADPAGLVRLVDYHLGEFFPVIITVGNHDTGIFTEYQEVMLERYENYVDKMQRDGVAPVDYLRCEGRVGLDQICSFRNHGIVLSGVGSTCGDDDVLNENLAANLRTLVAEGVKWRTTFIHKNQRLLQTGGKSDEVGIEAYKESLKAGAVMMNSHEHQYARTKELYRVGLDEDDFEFIDKDDIEYIDDKEVTNIHAGSFLVILNGLGGKSIREPKDDLDENPWWSTVINDDTDDVDEGAHICEYNYDGDETLAYCFFETYKGNRMDEYFLRNEN